MFKDVNKVSNGCSLNCTSSPRVKARGLIELRPSVKNLSIVEVSAFRHFIEQNVGGWQSTECRIIRLLSKNVRFVISLEVEQEPRVRAFVRVCMYVMPIFDYNHKKWMRTERIWTTQGPSKNVYLQVENLEDPRPLVESTECRIIRLLSKNVRFVISLEVEQEPRVRAFVRVCMYVMNIRL